MTKTNTRLKKEISEAKRKIGKLPPWKIREWKIKHNYYELLKQLNKNDRD